MNTMTIKDFIDTQYPVIEKLKSRFSNIFAKIDNNDNLPYDIIGPDEDGNITKLVEVEEGRYVSVYDLLSMSKLSESIFPERGTSSSRLISTLSYTSLSSSS